MFRRMLSAALGLQLCIHAALQRVWGSARTTACAAAFSTSSIKGQLQPDSGPCTFRKCTPVAACAWRASSAAVCATDQLHWMKSPPVAACAWRASSADRRPSPLAASCTLSRYSCTGLGTTMPTADMRLLATDSHAEQLRCVLLTEESA